jgi:hypothetical protein
LHHSADIHSAWENVTVNIKNTGKKNIDHHEGGSIHFGVMKNDKICRKRKKIKLQGLQDLSHTNVDNGCTTMGQRIHRSNFRINNNIYL